VVEEKEAQQARHFQNDWPRSQEILQSKSYGWYRPEGANLNAECLRHVRIPHRLGFDTESKHDRIECKESQSVSKGCTESQRNWASSDDISTSTSITKADWRSIIKNLIIGKWRLVADYA
jgi:hypothetical protein